MAQFDIKKVLAYSTVSQLGYMFLAMSVGAFSAGIFHLLTHAAFKAALFMASGSVIVALHHKQDMRGMGGLLKKMPITGWSFIAATFAIMGFPLTSGFFSKDEVLYHALMDGNIIFWGMGIGAALLTAFYMFRLVFMTFHGESRVDPSVHPHESPKVMTLPLLVLAIGAVFAGWLGYFPCCFCFWFGTSVRTRTYIFHSSKNIFYDSGWLVIWFDFFPGFIWRCFSLRCCCIWSFGWWNCR